MDRALNSHEEFRRLVGLCAVLLLILGVTFTALVLLLGAVGASTSAGLGLAGLGGATLGRRWRRRDR